MYKIILLFYFMAFSNALFAGNLTADSNELELIKGLYSENLINKRQYLMNQDILLIENKNAKGGSGGTAIINGNVQDNLGAPIEGATIRVYDFVTLNFVASTPTDASGNYSVIDLPAGNYVVAFGRAYNDYINYVWESTSNLICISARRCDVPIPITSQITLIDAQVVNNINFIPEIGGKITGNIKDAISLLPITTFNVIASNTVSYYDVTALVDQVTGEFSINGIPDGDYRIYLKPINDGTFSSNLHIPQIYGGSECSACGRLAAQGIGSIHTIASANTINNITFLVNIGGSISGKLVDAVTLNPLMDYGAIIIFNEFNQQLMYKIIYGINHDATADGSYILGGLPAGSYYVQGGDLGREFYQRELYSNKPCYYGACIRGAGDAVVISEGENKTNIDFLLDKGGKISGTLTDSISGLPVQGINSHSNIFVEFLNNLEQVIGSAFVKADGTYIAGRAMPAGNYAVRTGSMFQGQLSAPYVNEKYNDIDCPGMSCDLTSEDVAVVTESTTENIDFELTTGKSFSGTITDVTTGNPLSKVHVLVYKDMGAGIVKFANWATTSDGSVIGGPPIGVFEVTGLTEGTYYARTNNGSNLPFLAKRQVEVGSWIDILYSNIPCPGICDVTTGTPIVLGPLRGTATVVDFSLNQGATISGEITDFLYNGAIEEVSINIFNDQGEFISSIASDEEGKYTSKGLEAGTYFLTTSSFDVLVDVKYGNEACMIGNCNPLDATPIVLSSQQNITNINFVIKSDYLFGNQFN